MSLGSIIRRRRRDLGMTQDQVAAYVDISKPYLSNIETAKVKNPPTDGVLRALEKALSFAPGELVKMGHLERTPSDVRGEYEGLVAENEKLRSIIQAVRRGKMKRADLKDMAQAGGAEGNVSAGVLVPVINRVAAGMYPHHFTDLDYPPSVADEYIRCPDVHDPQAFAARVVGDSMEPEYHEGDIVVFSPNQVAESADDCFVRFEEGEGTTFKRAYQDDADTVRLQPLNSAYPAKVYRREQITGLWPATFRIQKVRQS